MKIVLFLLLVLPTLTLAAIYKHVDKDGNVTFSDQPKSGGAKVILRKDSTFTQTRAPKTAPSATQAPADQPYDGATITAPKNKQSFHNVQKIDFEIKLDPELREGDRVQFYLDGKAMGPASDETEVIYHRPNPGEHTVSAVVVSQQGESLIATAPVIFFVHRTSILRKLQKVTPVSGG